MAYHAGAEDHADVGEGEDDLLALEAGAAVRELGPLHEAAAAQLVELLGLRQRVVVVDALGSESDVRPPGPDGRHQRRRRARRESQDSPAHGAQPNRSLHRQRQTRETQGGTYSAVCTVQELEGRQQQTRHIWAVLLHIRGVQDVVSDFFSTSIGSSSARVLCASASMSHIIRAHR